MHIEVTWWVWLMLALSIASLGCGGDGAAARSFTLSTWCWESECVVDEGGRVAALAFAKAHAIDSMYLQLSSDYEEPESFDGLAKLARSAQSQGMALRWVEGRPEWALPGNHAPAVAAIERAARINTQLLAAGRAKIPAVVFDVEPYTLPEWEDDPVAVTAGYVAMVEQLHDAATRAGIGLWVALPFWYEMEAALHYVDGLVLMAYRDNADEIESAARPAVERARGLHVPVILGLETKCVEPSFISFCGQDGAALGAALKALRTRFESERTVIGFAVHELSSWEALDRS